jgi:hypothetical protein
MYITICAQENPTNTWLGIGFSRTQHDITGLNNPDVHSQVLQIIYPNLIGSESIQLQESSRGYSEIQLKWLHDPFLLKNSFVKIGLGYQFMHRKNVHPYYSYLYTVDTSVPTLDISASGASIDVAVLRKTMVTNKLMIVYGAGVNIGYLFDRKIQYQKHEKILLTSEGGNYNKISVIKIRDAIQHKYFAEVGLLFECATQVHVELVARFGNAYEEIFEFKSSVFDDLKGVNIGIWYDL